MAISGATVVLLDSRTQKETSVQTSSDGSYSIRDIVSGLYYLAVYADHFVGQRFGDKLENLEASSTSIAVGISPPDKNSIRVEAEPRILDITLHREAEVTAINDAPLADEARRRRIFCCEGRFAPDGKYVALTTSDADGKSMVWRYEIDSRRLEHITDRDRGPVNIAWGADGTLYVRSELLQQVRTPGNPLLLLTAAKGSDIRNVEKLPADVAQILEEQWQEPTTNFEDLASRYYQQNDAYRVTMATAHGNFPFLIIQERNRDRPPQRIALDESLFVFDRKRSEVIYQKSSRWSGGSVMTILSLQTGKSNDVFLNLVSSGPLDLSPDASVLAIAVRGECTPDEVYREQFLHPERVRPETPYRTEPRYHTCLVKLPNAEK